MALSYSDFDSTPATLVADLKAKIILSTDWANITGNIVKATTTDGAQIVLDLTASAIATTALNLAVYRTHDGSTGVDQKLFFLPWKRTTAATSATSDPLHCKVSAGKDHLYIEIEGPRGGELNAESATIGSARNSFFIGAVTSYWDTTTDPVPTVVAVGNYTSTSQTQSPLAYVGRNAANSASWVPAYLTTLTTVATTNFFLTWGQPVGLDGKTYLLPWVVTELTAGIRGRIKMAWYGGPTGTDVLYSISDPLLKRGQRYTYSGVTYQLMNPVRANGTGTSGGLSLAWSNHTTSIQGNDYGALVAIPAA